MKNSQRTRAFRAMLRALDQLDRATSLYGMQVDVATFTNRRIDNALWRWYTLYERRRDAFLHSREEQAV